MRCPDIWRTIGVPTLGGLVLFGLALWAKDRFRGQLADAVEANALRGGRLSVGGSLYLVAALISNGFGASVGLEAAYTQLCSAFSSLFGRTPRRRAGRHAVAGQLQRLGAIAGARLPATWPSTPSERSSAPIRCPRSRPS